MVIAEEEDAEEADFGLGKTIGKGKARGRNSVFRWDWRVGSLGKWCFGGRRACVSEPYLLERG